MKNNNNYDLKKKYAKLTFKHCIKIFGYCERKKRKPVLIISDKYKIVNNSKYFGRYCNIRNNLIIYINNCDTILEVVGTVIHEYTHYLQPYSKYKKYEKIYSYNKNPFEKDAVLNEKIYTNKIYNKVKNQLRISKSDISLKNKKSLLV